MSENDLRRWAGQLGDRLLLPGSRLTVRELYEAVAMAGLLNWRERQDTPARIGQLAVQHADALLLEQARAQAGRAAHAAAAPDTGAGAAPPPAAPAIWRPEDTF